MKAEELIERMKGVIEGFAAGKTVAEPFMLTAPVSVT